MGFLSTYAWAFQGKDAVAHAAVNLTIAVLLVWVTNAVLEVIGL
jgi:hypothetical protein